MKADVEKFMEADPETPCVIGFYNEDTDNEVRPSPPLPISVFFWSLYLRSRAATFCLFMASSVQPFVACPSGKVSTLFRNTTCIDQGITLFLSRANGKAWLIQPHGIHRPCPRTPCSLQHNVAKIDSFPPHGMHRLSPRKPCSSQDRHHSESPLNSRRTSPPREHTLQNIVIPVLSLARSLTPRLLSRRNLRTS